MSSGTPSRPSGCKAVTSCALLVCKDGSNEWGPYEAGTDAVDTNLSLSVVEGHVTSKSNESRLRRAIRRAAAHTGNACHRRGMDDAPASGREMRQSDSGTQIGPLHIDREDAIPAFFALLCD